MKNLSTRSGPTIRFHPGTQLFVPLSDEALAKLASDIKTSGLKDRIAFRWIKDEAQNDAVEVIHGRFRLAALERNGAELFRDGKPNASYFREFDPATDGTPVQFIVSENIRHRPLYEAILDRAAPPVQGRGAAKGRPAAARRDPLMETAPRAVQKAAELLRPLEPAGLAVVLKGLVTLYEGVGSSSEQAARAAAAGLAAIDQFSKGGVTSRRSLQRRLTEALRRLA